MNKKDCFKLVSCFGALFLAGAISACQIIDYPEILSPESNFQIHLLSLSQIVDLREGGEEIDILDKPQYIILDEQIKSYDWSQQMIVFEDTVYESYVSDPDFLTWPSMFAIVWDGKIVAEGEVLDTVSPVFASYPIVYVLEPRGDPNFSSSSYKTVGNISPNPSSVLSLSILLRPNRTTMFVDNDLGLIYEDSVAEEIKNHFGRDGRLID